MTKAAAEKNSQLERFKKAARVLETDDGEEAFDRALKKVARPSATPKPSKPKKAT